MSNLEEKINKLMELGRQAVELSDVCKANEPSLTISFLNDGSVGVDFYSYVLDLQDGGRHHVFHATRSTALIDGLDDLIIKAEAEIKMLTEEKRFNGN